MAEQVAEKPQLESPLPRWLIVLLGAAAVTIAVAGMHEIAGILAPALLALVLTVAFHPVRGWFASKHLPSWLITLLMAAIVYAVVLAFAVSMALAVARFATLVPQYHDEADAATKNAQSWLASMGIGADQTKSITSQLDFDKLSSIAATLLNQVASFLSSLFFVIVLLLFLAMDGGWFSERLEQARDGHAGFVQALEAFAHGTRSYLIVSTIFGLIVAAFDTTAIWLLGIPAPLVWGLLAFITNYVPNIGFVLGLIPVALLAYLEGGLSLMLAVIAIYCVLNVIIQSIIQPRIVGDTVGLSTTLTFVSLIFWGWVLGPLGALLAIPTSLFAKALLIDVDDRGRWLAPLVGGSGASAKVPDQID